VRSRESRKTSLEVGVEVGFSVVATEGDEVVVAFLLVALEPERHGMILGYRVRAWRECPHLRIEIWGTRFCGKF
jgi:hypothetical protein